MARMVRFHKGADKGAAWAQPEPDIASLAGPADPAFEDPCTQDRIWTTRIRLERRMIWDEGASFVRHTAMRRRSERDDRAGVQVASVGYLACRAAAR